MTLSSEPRTELLCRVPTLISTSPPRSALKVKLTCSPYRPCGGGNEATGPRGDPQSPEAGGKGTCGPSQTQEREMWEEVRKAMGPERESRGGGKDPEQGWFRCEADTDLTEPYASVSPAGTSPFVLQNLELLC